MSPPEPDAALRAMLAEWSGAETGTIGPDDDLREALDLDSLAALRLLASVEQHFDVRFPDERLSDLRTIRRLLEAIAEARPGKELT